jgi:hypothetical protein
MASLGSLSCVVGLGVEMSQHDLQGTGPGSQLAGVVDVGEVARVVVDAADHQLLAVGLDSYDGTVRWERAVGTHRNASPTRRRC